MRKRPYGAVSPCSGLTHGRTRCLSLPSAVHGVRGTDEGRGRRHGGPCGPAASRLAARGGSLGWDTSVPLRWPTPPPSCSLTRPAPSQGRSSARTAVALPWAPEWLPAPPTRSPGRSAGRVYRLEPRHATTRDNTSPTIRLTVARR
jgi:hypothetical protein